MIPRVLVCALGRVELTFTEIEEIEKKQIWWGKKHICQF